MEHKIWESLSFFSILKKTYRILIQAMLIRTHLDASLSEKLAKLRNCKFNGEWPNKLEKSFSSDDDQVHIYED